MDDPRNVFLDAREVMRRYGWGKTKGYQNLKDRDLVPPPVMTHPTAGDSTSSWHGRRSASRWPRPRCRPLLQRTASR